MKNIRIIFPITLMLLSSALCYAQKTISEGAITYGLTIRLAGSDSSAANILGRATVIESVKGGLSRTDMSSSLGTEATIYDTKTGTGVILKEYSGQKLMITLTKENWEARNKKFDGIVFKYDNAGDKSIGGYTCKKATTQLSDGTLITVYYTTDINVLNKEYNSMFKNLGGTPVQYEVTDGKFTYKYTLSKIDLSPITSAKFDLPKSGYREMTYEESEQHKSN
jgi:GLPGLI family protein